MTNRASELIQEILALPADERDDVVARLRNLTAGDIDDAQAVEIGRRIREVREGKGGARLADEIFDELEALAARHSA